jgi:hypothetical protein
MTPEALAKIHESVMRSIQHWSEDDRAAWDERAATLEYERSDTYGSRMEADVLAFWQIRKERGQ